MTVKNLTFFIPSCFFLLLILAGCSSLHVDMLPTVDWSTVQIVEFQAPPQDRWNLTEPIQTELLAMDFQVVEDHRNPDLLFSYFTQEGIDLTVESEKVLRLRSLHVQFIDPKTKNLVAAADYFYPDNAQPSDFPRGIKELFAGIRQQSQHQPVVTPAASVKAVDEPEALTTEATIATPQPEATLIKQPTPETSAAKNQTEQRITNPSDRSSVAVETATQNVTPVLDKDDEKMQQAVQKTRSPWVPKFQSWGFENWGEESMDDY
ncbi:hypothetical protein SAMN05660420_02665 [Desulfuromusa kysingii]|uniref:Uncharacterized protein n=1 Tax=Desulfuromusa kysingii TaxID=37625 RepID=A0A1H4CQ32_9BACT|nr:DUF4136 domain-containing protein [Desulfuromusa kysingii]SEA62521.1 hypothetical protein SAMN05660420_02665 [Desulfuromusa kysingii]